MKGRPVMKLGIPLSRHLASARERVERAGALARAWMVSTCTAASPSVLPTENASKSWCALAPGHRSRLGGSIP
jgi:hypothetical protein